MDPRNGVRGRGISSRSISSALSSAAAEWAVIFLLFLHGFLSHIARKLARYWNLQPPCLLCSSLDCILGEEDLICHDHRLEIVSTASNDHLKRPSKDTDSNASRIKLKGEELANLPLLKTKVLSDHDLSDEEDRLMGKQEDNSSIKGRFSDHLPHIGYKEVKVTSDSESERPHSDGCADEDALEHKDVMDVSEKKKLPDPLIPLDQSDVLKHVEGDPTHGLAELNWNIIYEKDHHPLKLQLASEPTASKSGAASSTKDNGFPPLPDKIMLHVSSSKLAVLDAESVSPAPIMEAAKDSNRVQIGSPMLNHIDLNDAYKMAIAYRMNQGSPRDSHGVNDDLKTLVFPSPRVNGHSDDLKMFDASMASIQRNLSRKFSFERNESGTESLDGSSMISEIEGECAEDRMKRQIDIDRRSMALLYKELEEERNASAISTNQAMAMITRLQEEKALMQMEALQYQRMMEEQSEYDQEALQKLQDALSQKDAELDDMKAEVERCRKLLGDVPEVKDKETRKGDDRETLETSAFDSDNGKQYVSEWLKRLEKKLPHSEHGSHADEDNSNVESARERHDKEQGHEHEKIPEEDEASQIGHRNLKKANGNSELHEPESGSEQSSTIQNADLSEFEVEFPSLNERLKALEDDRSFLEHIVNSLRNEDDAVQFVREIACHLRELRRIGVRRRDQITL